MILANYLATVLGFIGLVTSPSALAQQALPGDTPARPVGNPGEWFAGGYPVEAMKARVEGRVGFALDIGSDGKPTGCRVIRPSNSALLDDATCAIAMEKARFEAGTGARRYSSSVRWTLPAAPPLALALEPVKLPNAPEGKVGASDVTVGADGIIEKCAPVPRPFDNVLGPPDICSMYPVGARFSPPTTRNGHPQRRRVRIEISTQDTYLG
jgi:TonB family protein